MKGDQAASPLPAILSRERAGERLHRLLRATRADAAEGSLTAHREKLTAFAANSLRHTITEESLSISLAAVFDRRVVRVCTTRDDDAALEELAKRAEAFARVPQESNLEMDLAAAPSFMPADKFDPAIIHDDHEAQMEDVAQVVRLASERGLDAAGYLLSRVQQEVVINSTGLEAFSLGTQAGAAITMRRVAAHLETSGYGAIASWQAEAVRLDDLSVAVANKAIWGGAPERIPPGEYTVILEPLAVAELLLFLADGFNARSVEENDSFLTGKLGERCFSPCLTLLDDFSHPLQSGVPFDGEGWPRNKVTLINAGRVSELLYDRATAARMGAAPTGHGLPIPNPDGAQAANLVLAPGEHSNEALVSGCERGILVTRFWYVRPVDPGTMTLTGLTRDGTFLIEEGHVVRRLADLRWNESLLRAFARLDAVGRQPAVVSMEETTVVTPAVRIPGFRFVS